MEGFIKEIGEIYRLKVPFDTVYTSVFLIRTENGAILVDCATTAQDVEQYILPALEKAGVSPQQLTAIILTHSHDDHAGGLQRLLAAAPQLRVVTEVCGLGGGIETYPMSGHTKDCIGILDLHTHTLLSGDGLQGAGVDKYRCYVEDKTAYRGSIGRVRNDARVENILFSHEYEPWYEARRMGREAVLDALTDCLNYI